MIRVGLLSLFLMLPAISWAAPDCEKRLLVGGASPQVREALDYIFNQNKTNSWRAGLESHLGIFKIADRFGIAEPKDRFDLVMALLEGELLYDADGNDGIMLYAYTPEQQPRALEKLAAWVHAWPEKDRETFVLALVEQAKPRKLVFLVNLAKVFGIKDPKVVHEINLGQIKAYLKRWNAKRHFENIKGRFIEQGFSRDPWDLIRWSLEYPLFFKHVPYAEYQASVHAFASGNSKEVESFLKDPAIRRMELRQYGMFAIGEELKTPLYRELPLRPFPEAPDAPTLMTLIAEYQTQFPGVIPQGLPELVASGTGDRDTFIYLFDRALRDLEGLKIDAGLDFFGLLDVLLPWPPGELKQWRKQGRQDVLALAAEIFDLTEADVFQNFALDAKDFPKGEDVARLLELVRNNYLLAAVGERMKVTKKNPKPKMDVLKEVLRDLVSIENKVAVQVSGKNVSRLIKLGEEQMIERLKAEMSALDSDIEFTYKDLQRLAEEWSDIEPVLTLFARIQQPGAKREVLKIFRASLDGHFEDFKFHAPEAEDQVGFLSPEQLEDWKRSRVRISMPDLNRNTDLDLAAQVAARMQTDWANHYLKTELPELLRGQSGTAKLALPLIEEAANANPMDVLNRYFDKNKDGALALASSLIGVLEGNPESIEGKREAARLLHALINRELATNMVHELAKMSAILKSIERAIPKQKGVSEEAEGFTATVVDHSPRLLLTVGDLVDIKSCLNYRTGGQIRTLPAYVVDANVRVMASFQVEARHFADFKSYRQVFTALQNGEVRNVAFNGNKRILTFELNDGKTLATGYLGHAYLRQIVKLGYVKKDGTRLPSLRLERAYSQLHPRMGTMTENHAGLLKDLVKDLNAIQDQTMKIRKSRNPEGIYSDLSTRENFTDGVHLGSCFMEPERE